MRGAAAAAAVDGGRWWTQRAPPRPPHISQPLLPGPLHPPQLGAASCPASGEGLPRRTPAPAVPGMGARGMKMFTLLVFLSTCLLLLSFWITSGELPTSRDKQTKERNIFTNNSQPGHSQQLKRNGGATTSKPDHHTSRSNLRSANSSVAFRFLKQDKLYLYSEDFYIQSFRKVQNCTWTRRPEEYYKFRSKLASCCNAVNNFIVSQNNTSLGSNMSYEVDTKKNIVISETIFKMLPQSQPFVERSYKHCAVVGNGGILQNSSCGAEIDESDFVFRCNLPPVNGDFHKDVGNKTNVVTVNPSIIALRYGKLSQKKTVFLQNISKYGDAYFLLPAFSYRSNTAVCFKVFNALKEAKANQKAIFFHPKYLKNLGQFWRANGVRAYRLSTGLMIASAAIELCDHVKLYGFWPFSKNTEGNLISHHYYDNQLPKPGFHAMPKEFIQYLQLHNKGILKLQVGECENKTKI
ncbi:alpha-2,8-sialyltransferase 8F isoform X2 [Ambystoma mexicanum]|uniref:alpha-2,8-sialyltransferase 8F isoform X2 n=1 Tax=Ambystoma mexicanum TaxID=8296 RepID=UPI0037E8643B